MPKIKLSALVSDMKGKANGSVFSSNAGGVYYRNNPSGGGKKSAKWDKQKSLFSSLSTQWRALSSVQQDAWRAIVGDYPTKNAFSDVRIPSGYELFMRLNGSLSSVGFPLLSSPLPAPVFPPMGSVVENFPSQFQLNPISRFSSWNVNIVDNFVKLVASDFWSNVQLASNRVIGFHLELKSIDGFPFNTAGRIDLVTNLNSFNFGWSLYLTDCNTANPLLHLDIRLQNGVAVITSILNKEDLVGSFHIALQFTSVGASSSTLYLNGSQLITNVVASGNQNIGIFSTDMTIFDSSTGIDVFGFISDLREYDTSLTDDEIKLFSKGYVLGKEISLFPFIQNVGNKFVNFSNKQPSLEFKILSYSASVVYVSSFLAGLVPLFSLEVLNFGNSDTYINIFCTPPISRGVSSKQSNLKLLGTFPWKSNKVFDLSTQIKSLFGNVPQNSQIVFYVTTLSKSTGSQPLDKIQAKRKIPRFKAGTSLDSKVG